MATIPTGGATEEQTWQARRGLAVTVRVLVFIIPIVASLAVLRLFGPVLYRPSGWPGLVLWIAQAAPVSATVARLTDRATRRALPLATLLELSLVFPDHAPSRFSTALRAGTVRKLSEAVEEATTGGLGDDENQAAGKALQLVALLGEHDRFTRGHAERVRAYSDLIAEEMGLSEEDRLRLAWGVILHDMGKLTVPGEVLNKKGKLTQEDWKLLSEHPAAGVKMLEPLSNWLGDWILAAGEHHERWDGDGYPNGLAGVDISLAGRITAVADAYDVITSKRSYKKPMSAEAARNELVACAGGQFDPDVVRAFVNVSLNHRWTLGPLAWLADLPIGQLGTAAAHAPAVAVTGAVLAVGTGLTLPPQVALEDYSLAFLEESSSTSTTPPTISKEAARSVVRPTAKPSSTSPVPPTSRAASSSTLATSTTTQATTTTSQTTTAVSTTTTTLASTSSQTTTSTAHVTTTTEATTTTTEATTTTLPGIVYGGHRYLVGTPGLTWTQARDEATTLGGYLVSVTSSEENGFVLANFAGDRPVWLGFSDVASEDTYVWESGEPFSFNNWIQADGVQDGEPISGPDIQDYGAMAGSTGEWDDQENFNYSPSVYVANVGWQSVPHDVVTLIEFDS